MLGAVAKKKNALAGFSRRVSQMDVHFNIYI